MARVRYKSYIPSAVKQIPFGDIGMSVLTSGKAGLVVWHSTFSNLKILNKLKAGSKRKFQKKFSFDKKKF